MKHHESKIQQSIVDAVRYMYPKGLIFSIPNEGKRKDHTGKFMVKAGLLKGVADLIFIIKGQVIFFEVKNKTKQSEYQKEFQLKVEEQGLKYFIVHSADETLGLIEKSINA